MTSTNTQDVRARLVGVDAPTRDDHAATKKYVDDHGGGGSVDVTDGVTTVTGLTELDFTSGATVTDAGGGVAQVAVSGGSQPVTRGRYFSDDVTVAANDAAALHWGALAEGDALLNLTNPARPVVVASGTYAVTIRVAPSDVMTAGDYFLPTIQMDEATANEATTQAVGLITNANLSPVLPLSLTWYIPAGGGIVVFCTNTSMSAHDYSFAPALVQRVA